MASSGSTLPRSLVLKHRYELVDGVSVEHEDRFTEERATEIWQDIYNLFRATTEEARDAVKVAVYAYYAVNGTSRAGKYARSIVASGESIAVSEVNKKIVGGTLRAFMRSDVQDAYAALKHSEVLEADEVFVAKCIEKGVPAGSVHCAVDFLRGCPDFTNEEARYAEMAFKSSILRANAARGGKSLEKLESESRRSHNTVGTTADADMAGGGSDNEF